MKHSLVTLFVVLCFTPLSARAEENDLLDLVGGVVGFIDGFVIPFLLAVGFIAFAINVVRYFIIDSTDDEGRKNARALALYGVTAFVIILIFWGIVNLFTGALGLRDRNDCIPVSEYFFGESCIGEPSVPDPDGPEPLEPPELDGPSPEPPELDGPSPESPQPPEPPKPGDSDSTPWGAVISAEEAVRGIMNNYASNFDDLYGISSTALVDAGLFADFDESSRSDSFNDLDRLQAAYRLRELGELSETEFTNYYDAVNNYRTDMIGSGGTIPMSEVEAIAIPTEDWPADVKSHNLIIAGGVESELEAYNERVEATGGQLNESEIAHLVDTTTDISLPLEDRLERFEALLGDNPDGIVYIRDENDSLYNSFVQEQNAERLLLGASFEEIF